MPYQFSVSHRRFIRQVNTFGALYAVTILFSLHWSLILYINSSFLQQYVPATSVGMLYTVGYCFTILIFLITSRVLRKVGNYALTLSLIFIEFLTLLGLAFSHELRFAIPLFLIHLVVVPLIFFNFDIYLEKLIGEKEKQTGSRRGLMLGIINFAAAIAVLSSGRLVDSSGENFTFVYLGSAFLLIPVLYICIRYFSRFPKPDHSELRVLEAFRAFWVRKDVRNVLFAHIHLHFFFSWMVIYVPLYLVSVVGFSWTEVGIAVFCGIIAFVFFEYPVGIIADTYLGEKEMMALGFMIMASASASFAFLVPYSIVVWCVAMFISRIGASLVETTTETYFFKHMKDTDTNVISFFRIAAPFAGIIGALSGSLLLLFMEFNLLFIVLGFLMVPGLFFTMALKDTR